jgi:hypothetical protein
MPSPKIQLRFALALTAAVLAASSLIGCQTSPSPPPTTGAAYIGPLLTLESGDKHHQVIASTPSAGWTFTFDRTELNDGRHDLFLTLRRPNPLFSYSSTPVEQRAASSVRSTVPVDVYARICDFDAADPGPYSLAIPHTPPTP